MADFKGIKDYIPLRTTKKQKLVTKIFKQRDFEMPDAAKIWLYFYY